MCMECQRIEHAIAFQIVPMHWIVSMVSGDLSVDTFVMMPLHKTIV